MGGAEGAACLIPTIKLPQCLYCVPVLLVRNMLTPLVAGTARNRRPSKKEEESRLKAPQRYLGQGVPPMTKHHNNQVAS